METYHKIQTLFKRHQDGPNKGKMIFGEWTTPELEYLAGNQWEFTEKVDGTNIRVELTYSGDVMAVNYGGRTDRAVIPAPLLEHLQANFPTFHMWRSDLAKPAYRDRYRLLINWMHDSGLDKVTLFGEGYGPKIQNGGNYRGDTSFVLFDVKIGDWWLKREDVDDVASKLGIDSVPVVGYGTLLDGIRMVAGGPQIVFVGEKELDAWKQPMRSTWGDFEAEGIVARPVVPLFNRKRERIITKIKAVDFK